MRRLSLLPTLLLSLALTFSLAACDSNDDGDDDGNGGGNGQLGDYSATLGGDLSGSLSGNAFFSVIEDPDVPGEQAFVLWLADGMLSGGMTGEYVAFVRYGDRPGTGEYSIDDDPESDNTVAAVYSNIQGQTYVGFVGETGTFTVTGSSGSSLEGTFSFSGPGGDTSDPQNPQEISGSINGSFDAVFIDPGEGPGIPAGGF